MNIAVIGGGNWGKNLVRTYHELDSLYAVCDSDSERLKHFQEQYSYIKAYSEISKLLEDPKIDGVVIATPAHTHYEIAMKTLSKYLPTYIEKPMTLNLKESETLRDTAKKNRLTLMVGHIMIYNPAIAKMKEIIDSGIYGKIKHIKCIRVNLGKIRSHENIWWSFAPHDLSIIMNFIDSSAKTVQARTFPSLQKNIEDTVYADIIFESGQTAHIHVSWLEPNKLHQTTIICEKAILVFTDTDLSDKLKVYEYQFDEKNIELRKTNVQTVHFDSEKPLTLECKHFLKSINSKSIPLTDGDSACRVIDLIEKVERFFKQK